jgi:hypothetical protein
MVIEPSKLTQALKALKIPTGEQVRYSKIAQALGIIPKKSYKGKETKQLLKEGSQKYKEFVYNEVLKKYNTYLEAEAEKAKQKKKTKKQKPVVKPKPKLVQKKLVESLKAKFYEKYNYKYENNETLLDLYNAIKDNLNGGTYVNIAFRDGEQNIIYWRSLLSDYLFSFEDFEEEINKIIEGESIGSDPINTNEYKLDLNLFSIGSVKIAQGGKSDDIIFNSKLIESKEGLCGYLCLLECGFDCKKNNIKPQELRDFKRMSGIIKEYKLPIVVYANGFSLRQKAEEIVAGERVIDIEIKDKKRTHKYKCAELNQDDIFEVILCEPDRDEDTGEYSVEPKHFLVYDEVNQHLDYLIGLPKLLKGVYLSVSNKVIRNNKIIFSPKEANINNTRVQKAPYEYIFFDYETVIDFNNSNCMQSYSLSVLFLDNLQLQELEELDLLGRAIKNPTEEQEEKRQKALNTINLIRQTNCKTFLGYDCGRQFINWFLEYSLDKVCVFIGFNNTNFDNFLMLEDFLKYNDEGNEVRISDIFYNGSQLLNFKIAGCHSFFDIRKHLVGSLKSNCNAFKIESVAKKDCDHAEMQRLHQAGELINYINTNDKLKEYNEYDVLATAVLYKRYVNALEAIEATKPYAKTIFTTKTIGSLIYKVFEDNKKTLNFDLPKLEYKQYDDLQKSKIAGRVEMFNGVQKVEERLVSTDVCSLYPFVMSVLDCYYPCGKELIEVDEYQGGDKIGFYYCDIDQSCLSSKDLPNIYAKKSALENDWSTEEVLTDYLISNVMIGLLRKFGCSVVIKSGFVFPQKKKSCEMFGFLLDFMKVKNEQDLEGKKEKKGLDNCYNPALRETLKLLMNSLSGKVIEGLHTEKTVDVDTVSEYLKIADKAKSVNFINSVGGKLFLTYEVDAEQICKKQQRPIYLGVLIYDYAKRYMYENSYSKIGKSRLLYTDTDASKFRHSDFIKWKEWIDTNNVIVPHHPEVELKDPRYKTHRIYDSNSKVFGSFEDELEDCIGDEYLFYCLEKKSWLYAYKKDGEFHSKYRFKGLNGSAQLLSLDEPFIESKVLKHKATPEREYWEEIKHSVKVESEYEVYQYYENNKKNNIENGNEIKFFQQVYSTGVAYILNGSFRKIVKNSAREVGVDDTDNYNNLMNKIQVQYIMKKINIYKK